MAVHIFRREATYYWRRRTPRALAICLNRPHLFLSLRTTSPVVARRLATQLDAIGHRAARAQLKKRLVDKEGRTDLLGHGHRNERALLQTARDRHVAEVREGTARGHPRSAARRDQSHSLGGGEGWRRFLSRRVQSAWPKGSSVRRVAAWASLRPRSLASALTMPTSPALPGMSVRARQPVHPCGTCGIAATVAALSAKTSQCARKKSGSALRNTTTPTSGSLSSAAINSSSSLIVSRSIRLIGGLLKVAVHQPEDGLSVAIWGHEQFLSSVEHNAVGVSSCWREIVFLPACSTAASPLRLHRTRRHSWSTVLR